MKSFLELIRTHSWDVKYEHLIQDIDFQMQDSFDYQDKPFPIQIQKKIFKNHSFNNQSKSREPVTNAQRDYKKNICRNIIRHAIKSMMGCINCQKFIHTIMSQQDSTDFCNFYNQNCEQITGFRVLKQYLIQSPKDDEQMQRRKVYFQKYLIWYLKNRASIQIIKGEETNPREYLRYSNEVLLYYVQRPHEWNSNRAQWRKKETLFVDKIIEINRFVPFQQIQCI